MSDDASHDLEAAKRLGREAGANREKFVGDCPYNFASPDLRGAWLRGFSEVRGDLMKEKLFGSQAG